MMQKICEICLDAMKTVHGHPLLTTECVHTFEFACIASNMKHGDRVCLVFQPSGEKFPYKGFIKNRCVAEHE